MTAARGVRRLAYLDALRIIAAFLVIVNHTNSDVFLSLTPGGAQWWASVLWYYLSRTAVPLFVMISGACLLGRTDSYKKTIWRIARVLIAALIFAYGVFVYDAWVNYGLWPRIVDFGTFLSKFWRMEILDDYWYVFMYVGLLIMLPFLQRMAGAMRGRDMLCLAGLAFAFDGLWPLITHYAPALEPPPYFDAPLFSSFIGCFFMGRWIREHASASRKTAVVCLAVLAATLVLSALLTYGEAARVGEGKRYLFMDARDNPMILTLIGAACAMTAAKALGGRHESSRREATLRELGGCAFAIYLMQGFIILQTEKRVFEPLCAVMPPLAAALVWELGVFAVALCAAWGMRRIPWFRRIL